MWCATTGGPSVLQEAKKGHSDFQVILFVFLLCFVCALLLSLAAYFLGKPQEAAKEFDQSKQMLIAAKILNHAGYFEILEKDGKVSRARFDGEKKILIADPQAQRATEEQIKQIAAWRIRPLLTDSQGNIFSLEEKDLDLADYLSENKKAGYADLQLKLFYAILPNSSEAKSLSAADLKNDLSQAGVYILPVSGFGLWAPIYGFIAIGPAGDRVIGTTWYEHGETPGLGANITEAWWQNQFYGKEIFQGVDLKTAEMGIIVVKGKVRDVYGNSPKAKSAVDGMSGATLTGDGVTQAYRRSLSPYRQFLIKRSGAGGKESSS